MEDRVNRTVDVEKIKRDVLQLTREIRERANKL